MSLGSPGSLNSVDNRLVVDPRLATPATVTISHATTIQRRRRSTKVVSPLIDCLMAAKLRGRQAGRKRPSGGTLPSLIRGAGSSARRIRGGNGDATVASGDVSLG